MSFDVLAFFMHQIFLFCFHVLRNTVSKDEKDIHKVEIKLRFSGPDQQQYKWKPTTTFCSWQCNRGFYGM